MEVVPAGSGQLVCPSRFPGFALFLAALLLTTLLALLVAAALLLHQLQQARYERERLAAGVEALDPDALRSALGAVGGMPEWARFADLERAPAWLNDTTKALWWVEGGREGEREGGREGGRRPAVGCAEKVQGCQPAGGGWTSKSGPFGWARQPALGRPV